MTFNIERLRNIGISAHIDSGKTTLTERMLFYTKKIHVMHEVKGKDGVGATMDSMELERERGITIASAATNVTWNGCDINIIDTPGHVDFTIEVERALRVLDGAVLVLCAVGGVQSQSLTVDRQLKRYNVPRIIFINKCDRIGADPLKVLPQIRDRLGLNAVLLQYPIGLEAAFEGVVDLVAMKSLYFDGENGERVRSEQIPASCAAQAQAYRHEMLESLSMVSDALAEAYLDGRETEELIWNAVREGTIAQKVAPVLVGSAYKNKGIQPLLDAIVRCLPSPAERINTALDRACNEQQVTLACDAARPAVALVFKIDDGRYGQLSYIRMYQGKIEKGTEVTNSRTGKPIRIGRLVRMHADSMEDIDEASAGDIVALFGADCISGDTLCGDGIEYTMTSMHVPEPVVSLALTPSDRKSADAVAKAINRFTKEDPTFRSYVDPESRQIIIKGMGELHLDVYIERMRREYGAQVSTGAPQVAFRETISETVTFDYTHKKQTGGAGQFGRVAGILEPYHEGDYLFVDEIRGGAIPEEYITSCDKGFRACLEKGSLIGFPIVGVKVTINDGAYHPVDSSDNAFQAAAIGAFRQAYARARPHILEPIMTVAVECPPEFLGTVLSSLNQRRGMIVSTTEDTHFVRIEATVPLVEMFGYASVLRSITQGKAGFSMEFARYARVPVSLEEKLKEEYERKEQSR